MASPQDVDAAPPEKRDLVLEAEPSDKPLAASAGDWSPEEERKAKRKLDLAIMPLLTLGFLCLQLDRGNIASAITDTFMEDVGITQFQFNVGQQLLSLGIILFDIPSDMALYKIRAGKWLTLQLFLFGLASAELIAYGILHIKGVAGQPGWFWLFVIIGGFTILSGIAMGMFLPDSYQKPRSWFLPSLRIFSERELHILRRRVEIDDPNKSNQKTHIGVAAFKKTFSNWLIWLHVFVTFFNNGPFRGFDTYGPTIIRSFGFPSLSSNALASVGLFLQFPVSYAFSWVSDTHDKRGETVMAGISMHMIGYLLNRSFTELRPRGVRYFGIVWTQTFANLPHPLNIAWLSLTCRDPGSDHYQWLSICGAQLFQEDDKPKYRRAFGLNSGLLGAALLLAGVRYTYGRYQHRNRNKMSPWLENLM